MARYSVTVANPLAPEVAFAKVADLSLLTEWDPGVASAEYETGETVALGTVWKVIVKGIGGAPIQLRYEVTELEPDTRMVAVADDSTLRSHDIISVEPDGEGGSLLTYDAELTMRGLFSPINLVLPLVFDKIGDKAAAGLVDHLGGRIVEQ